MNATVSGGSANTSRNWVTSDIQVKIGSRVKVIPGARMFRIVTMKLTPAMIEEVPRIPSPTR